MYITFGHKMCGFKLFLLNFFYLNVKNLFIYLFILTPIISIWNLDKECVPA